VIAVDPYERERHPTMTALLTTLTVLLPTLTVAAAALHTPRDAAGNPLPRSKRSLVGDCLSLVGLS
jgi:hypothetical protein